MSKYTPIIGLEVHVELKTASKMFCSCSADYFGAEPNTHTCPVCLGLPGALPVPNKTAIDWCMKIAAALNCTLSGFSKFDRKNYFYPDLSKSYQISQFDMPFGENGWIELSDGQKYGITRVHMEEDTGKLSHKTTNGAKESQIDFNRSGLPLVEIVTEPDFHDATMVKEYLQKLQTIVRYLDVSDADMEKGNMRLEPNISLQLNGKYLSIDSIIHLFSEREQKILEALFVSQKNDLSPMSVAKMFNVTEERIAILKQQVNEKLKERLPNYKVEVKNINSFRFVEKAIAYELERQEKILETGENPTQETRGWDEDKGQTFSQRVKEEANDYRYFPEPDIPPIRHVDEHISTLKSQVPELQETKIARFINEFSLTRYDAEIITREISTASYFESTVIAGKTKGVTPKQIANAIINKKVDITSLTPDEAVAEIAEGSQKDEISDEELLTVINDVIKNNEKAVTDYKNGKEPVIMFLVGQVMKGLGKKADAQLIKGKLASEIKNNGRLRASS